MWNTASKYYIVEHILTEPKDLMISQNIYCPYEFPVQHLYAYSGEIIRN